MRPRWLRIPTGCCTTAEVGVRLPRLSLRLTLGARQSTAATRCIQVRGEEQVWSNRTLRRLSPSSSNMESKRSFWVASVVQLRAIAKRTVARRTEMSVDIPSATQAAEYVRHCCPLIMEALPRTTARPRARTGVRLQSSHVEAISTLAVRLFRQQFAPQLDAVEWAPRLPCSSGGSHERSAWRRRRPRRYVMPHFRQLSLCNEFNGRNAAREPFAASSCRMYST
jgi:hypothetical protein